MFTDDEDKAILTFVVYFASGFKVQALSSNLQPAGMRGNVTIDEAAFHDRLAEVLKAAMALTMGAKVRLISTHNGVDNLFNQLINDSRAGQRLFHSHHQPGRRLPPGPIAASARSGAHPDTGGRGELEGRGCSKPPPPKDALEEYFCVPKQSSGVYIKRT